MDKRSIKKIGTTLAIFSLIFSKTSFAQPRIVAESPQVSSIGRYWDIPVGGYTGTPDISIPLYKLEIGGLALPISLSYHASGIKVKDESSWVGLGRTLNVGGMINKVVNGDEDTRTKFDQDFDKVWHGSTQLVSDVDKDKRNGFLAVDKTIIKNIMFSPYFKSRYQYSDPMEGYKDLDFINMLYQSNNGKYLFGNDLQRTYPDLIETKIFAENDFLPDLYLFNVNGLSGSWMYGLDNKPHEVKANNFKIEDGPNAWKITDAKGTQYVFNDNGRSSKSTTTYYNYSPNYASNTKMNVSLLPDSTFRYSSNVSTIHLNKMISPTGEEINIYYSKVLYNNKHAKTVTYQKEWRSTEFNSYGGSNEFANDIYTLKQSLPKPEDIAYSRSVEQSVVEELYPDSITSRNEVIKFIKSSRLDIPNGIRLSEIQVYIRSSNRLKLTKRILFDNDQYFDLKAPAVKDTDKRMKLAAVSKSIVVNGNSAPADMHAFVYESSPLPAKSNYNPSLDNILMGNSTGYDNQDNFGYISYLNPNKNVNDNDNNIDPANNQSGILQKIIYPTGGYIEYKYEANTDNSGRLGPGLRIKETSLKMSDSLLLKQQYTYSNGSQLQFNQFFKKQPTFHTVVDKGTPGDYIKATTYSNVISTAPYRSINLGGYGADVFVYENIDITELGAPKNGKTSYKFSVSTSDFNRKDDLIRGFPVGTNMSDIPADYPLIDFSAAMNPQVKYVSSLGNLLKKTVYKFSNNAYKKILEEENKFLTNEESRGPEQTIKVNTDLPVYRKSSQIWEVNFSSSAPDNSAKAISTSYTDLPGESRGVMQAIDLNVFSALEKAPGSAASSEERLKSLLSSATGKRTTRYWYPSQILFHNISQFYKKIDQQIVRTFNEDDESKFTETIKKFSYNTAEDIDANKVTDIMSDGNVLETTYLYAKDAGISQLDGRHILSEIVESSVYNVKNTDRRLISLQKNTYHADRPLLFEKLKFDLVKLQYETDYKINKYDLAANVTETTNAGGLKKSYRWNKTKVFPVAEAINASEADFFYESFEGTGIIVEARTGVSSFTGTYNTSNVFSAPANNRRYYINYWYLDNGKWKNSGDLAYTGQTLTGTLDDVRIFPELASVSTFTYDDVFGITSSTDGKNNTIFYDYDEIGRLKNMKDQNRNIIKTHNYNYSNAANWVDVKCNCLINPDGSTTGQVNKLQKNFNPRSGSTYNTLRSVTVTDRNLCPFSNSRLTQVFNKNNCIEGTGSNVEYTIPAGQYSSVVSQQEANDKALQSITALGQAFANSNGVCKAEFKIENYVNNVNSTVTVKFTNISNSKIYEVTVKGGGGANAIRNISIPGGTYTIEIKALGIASPFVAIAFNNETVNIGYTPIGSSINYTFNNQQIISGKNYSIFPVNELP